METALWRALAVFRTLGLAYAVLVFSLRHDEYRHPLAGWLVLALMAGWSVVVSVALRDPRRRTWPLLSVDLAVAVVAVVSSRWIDDPHRIAEGAQTLPVVWAAAPVLAFALRGGWRAGVVGAAAVGAADLLHRRALTAATANNIVLLVLAGVVVGYLVTVARRGEAALVTAREVEATTRERERLSRDIHDGVLQVLAMVARRGHAAGGAAAELGRLAAEQEQALRALVRSAPVAPPLGPGRDGGGVVAETDVGRLLQPFSSASVTVSTPAAPVSLAAHRAREVAAVVGAALANVAAHAGPGAHAWVLLETEDENLIVSIRDNGAGFAPDRLAAATATGRLGVSSSIVGRAREIGGRATVVSVPGEGTEVELRVPLR